VAAFTLSLAGALGFFLVFPAVLALVAALIVQKALREQTHVSGQRLANIAVAVSASAVVLGAATVGLLLPSIGCTRSGTVRGTCEANIRGIVQSMNVYGASAADAYPVVTYAPYTRALNESRGVAHAVSGGIENIYYTAPFPQAGSVPACVWILAAMGDVSTKQFICKSDCFATGLAETQDATGRCYDNFQNGRQLSYSFAYPWKADGTPGAWWKSTADSSIPIAADMTPMQGTGTPARNLAPTAVPADPRTWNSGNHQGEGQVVAFGDAHAEFLRRPDVGPLSDNIYSMSGTPSRGPAQFGGIPAGTATPQLIESGPAYDIVMLPVRNESTGGF
jgi:hypothetical protein